jgi:phosphate/sulfate permease
MANNSIPATKIIGIALVVIGLGLAYWGYRLSGSVGSQITQAVTGSDTDKVMTFYISGAVSLAVGLYLLIKK